jgi:hypothetical protein
MGRVCRSFTPTLVHPARQANIWNGNLKGVLMAKKSKVTFQKRQRERARQEKNKAKEARRFQAKQRRASPDWIAGGEGSDLAAIQPGPQPLPPQWDYLGGRMSDAAKEAQDDNL